MASNPRVSARILVLALLVTSPAVCAQAQGGTPALTPGQRVRITSPAHQMVARVGTVIAVSDDTIRVAASTPRRLPNNRWIETTDTVVMSRHAIDRLEVSGRKGTRAGSGAIIGALAGALVGGIAGSAGYEECTPKPGSWGIDCIAHDALAGSSATEAAGYGAVGGAVVGAGLGALFGSMVRWERWDAVHPHGGG